MNFFIIGSHCGGHSPCGIGSRNGVLQTLARSPCSCKCPTTGWTTRPFNPERLPLFSSFVPRGSRFLRVAAASVVGEGLDDRQTNHLPHGVAAVELPTLNLDVPVTVAPEDLVLEPGELSFVDRDSPPAPADAYMCAGCNLDICKGPLGCSKDPWRLERGGYLRHILMAKVYDVAVETPLEEAGKLSEALGCRLLLKREDLQAVKSFKLRGAYNKMASLSAEERERGVICSSAGNHAQGVALAAGKLGCRAVICMPVPTPEIKVAAVKRLGGVVELVGDSYQEAQEYAMSTASLSGQVFVAPYDDPFTIAGQGTIGAEILRQCGPHLDELHAVFVPVGGGGLVAGIAAYIKSLKPSVKVIGVEPTGANAMALSLARGRRVVLSQVDPFADGVAVKHVGAETFRLCRELVDGVVLVDNAAISAAIKDVFNETRSILEPAGALAVAGAKAYCSRHNLKGATVVAVTSGANMNFDRLRLVSELADVGARTEAMMAATIPERPGSFKDFVATAADHTDIMFTEFKYRYSAGKEAHILCSVGIRNQKELRQLLSRLNAAGFPSQDLSGLESAQVHLRHLVGGRARSYMGELPYERLFQVDFPERPGALRSFLEFISPAWNVTLFHYRNTGNQASTVLLGIDVPPSTAAAFEDTVQQLSDNWTFHEITGEALRVFNRFIS